MARFSSFGWAAVLLLAIPRRFWLKYRNRPNLNAYGHLSTPLLVLFSALAHRVITGYFGLPLLPRLYYYRIIGVLIAIGFFWGGWVTSGESARIAARAATHARTDLAASVCVSRFVAAPDAATQLATLRKTDPWARTDLLQKDGWTTLPGMKDQDLLSDTNVGDLCAQKLMTATLPSSHSAAKL